jgi:GT2 family glycosyltransferase
MARRGADDKPPSPRVSVVIVAYRSGPTLTRCLEALAAQTFGDFETLLVDNAESRAAGDGAPQAAARAFPQVRLIEAGANLGFSGGVNLGARQARGRWIAMLNPDAYADPDWLERLVAATEAYPKVRAFASRQLMAEDRSKLDGLGDVMAAAGFPFRGGYQQPDTGRTEPGEVFSACGGAMLIDRALFLELGGFDERLFCYCEDVDLGYRLRLIGEATLLVPNAVVRHVGAASTGGRRSDFAAFHGTRNRFWVFVKDTPPVLFWLTLPLHVLATLTLFARHATRGGLAAPMRGLAAGIRNIDVALAARREVQPTRKVGSWAIAKAMTWNPLDVMLRRAFIQAKRPTPRGGA